MSGKAVAIILVDAVKLKCERCGAFFGSEQNGYRGHYLVLCGYHLEADSFVVLNPGIVKLGVCLVTSQVLEEARKSFGTDEDLITIFLQN